MPMLGLSGMISVEVDDELLFSICLEVRLLVKGVVKCMVKCVHGRGLSMGEITHENVQQY